VVVGDEDVFRGLPLRAPFLKSRSLAVSGESRLGLCQTRSSKSTKGVRGPGAPGCGTPASFLARALPA